VAAGGFPADASVTDLDALQPAPTHWVWRAAGLAVLRDVLEECLRLKQNLRAANKTMLPIVAAKFEQAGLGPAIPNQTITAMNIDRRKRTRFGSDLPPVQEEVRQISGLGVGARDGYH